MMIRETLGNLPAATLPPGYRFRPYRPGDAATWVRILREAGFEGIDEARFGREFGPDEAALAERQLFVQTTDGTDVATATAWLDDALVGPHVGRIHWVAVVPGHQGRGLGKALGAALLHRFAELGHEQALLTTEDFRRNAIHVYETLGFQPAPRSEREAAAWRDIEPANPKI